MHRGIRSKSMTTVLLVTIAMAMSQGLATAQSSSSSLQRKAPLLLESRPWTHLAPSPAPFVQHGPLNLEATTLCSLSAPDAVAQPSAEGGGATSDSRALYPLARPLQVQTLY